MATAPVSSLSPSVVNIQDFLRILTSELTNQDPLKPMDNTEFVAQLAQFTSLQQTQITNEKLDSLLSIQAATQSVGLLGRNVEVNTPSGKVTATVTALDFASGEPRLTIRLGDGSVVTDVSLSNLVTVR